MIIQQLSRYPIKALNGEQLTKAQLEVGAGIFGDRRFAFGVDKSVDDGVWRSSRSYLINAVNDNLLKLNLTADGQGWRLLNPQGDVAYLTPDDSSGLEALNVQIPALLKQVPTEKTPRLIDRNNGQGPKGHWDFPDSELLIVNLATIRELEERWRFEIDPRRFRFNILVGGIPAWSEFGFYGSRFSIGEAHIDILRPARRCAATGVNPDTGERDEDILQGLVKDYGHGFLGVYARVSHAGEIAIGQQLELSKTNAIPPEQAVCPIAPDITFWPKATTMERSGTETYNITAIADWPLVEEAGSENVKIHHGTGSPTKAEILSISEDGVSIKIDVEDPCRTWIDGRIEAQKQIVISGPYALREKL